MHDISVVIPIWNRANLITETLLSIEKQTLLPLEVVLIDDYSTDDTRDVILEYARNSKLNIKLLKNKRKKGISGATNHGILNVKGEYIAFLDSDDIWTPNHLMQLRCALERQQDVSVSFSRAEAFSASNDAESMTTNLDQSVKRMLEKCFIKTEHDIWLSNDQLFYSIALSFPFRCPAAIVKTCILNKHGILFDEDMGFTQEAHFMTIVSYYARFLYVDKVGLRIRKHPEHVLFRYADKIPSSYKKRYWELKKFSMNNITDRKSIHKLDRALFELRLDAFSYEIRQKKILGRICSILDFFWAMPNYRTVKSIVNTLISK